MGTLAWRSTKRRADWNFTTPVMAVVYFRVLRAESAVAAFEIELCEQLLVKSFLKLRLDGGHRSSKHYTALAGY
ncbi:MAG: hypothetical protein ACHQ03_07320 [Candidatus Bathyarchaeia archaeon]